LSHPAYAALQYPQPFDLNKVQQEVLDPETLLLEFMLGEKQSFLWAVSKKGCQMVALPGREEIERQVKGYPPSDHCIFPGQRSVRPLLQPGAPPLSFTASAD
jgi:hypothetical protein